MRNVRRLQWRQLFTDSFIIVLAVIVLLIKSIVVLGSSTSVASNIDGIDNNNNSVINHYVLSKNSTIATPRFDQRIRQRRRRRRKLQQYHRRPKIYTFWSHPGDDIIYTGMSIAAHKKLLIEWKSAWYDEGWDPIILTIDDAKQHPEFTNLVTNTIDKYLSNLDGYNRMCFIRWIAIASIQEGGWMTDNDIFPLPGLGNFYNYDDAENSLILPNNGILTIHDRFIPNLLSGTSEEYIRVLKLIINNTISKKQELSKQHDKFLKWSDMLALGKINPMLISSKETYYVNDMVFNNPFTSNLFDENFSKESCQKNTIGKNVIHFSHIQIDIGRSKKLIPKFGEGETNTIEKRTEIIQYFMTLWKKFCS